MCIYYPCSNFYFFVSQHFKIHYIKEKIDLILALI